MPKYILKLLFLTATVIFMTAQSWAHVPYFEENDFSAQQPFKVEYAIEQSLAIYAWLENNDRGYSEDVDVFVFQITKPADVYIEVIVPVCQGYEEFLPRFALAGPGLPAPKAPMPFEIPSDFGIVMIKNLKPGEPRDIFTSFLAEKAIIKALFLMNN